MAKGEASPASGRPDERADRQVAHHRLGALYAAVDNTRKRTTNQHLTRAPASARPPIAPDNHQPQGLCADSATGRVFDILPAASGEDSYGVGSCSDLFGGFLSQPPYFGGGQPRGFTFGLSSHRSCGQKKDTAVGRKKERWALYPRPERRGFTAPLVSIGDQQKNCRVSKICPLDQNPGAPVEAGRISGALTPKRRCANQDWLRDMKPV